MDLPHRAEPDQPGLPAGAVYDWYRQGTERHRAGDPYGAIEFLQWAVAAEPEARSVREALARAQYDARQFVGAAESFRIVVDADAADHYAHFGLGLTAIRIGDHETAVTHLALAVALEPGVPHYEKALRAARAARTRSVGGGSLPGTGPAGGPVPDPDGPA